jgi:long-chain fatty acid transport protein
VPAALAAAISLPAGATNGYFTHGVGTHSKAMAGAGDASPTMAIDVANNPAAGILVDESLDLGGALFSPRRYYETTQSQLNGQFGAFTLDAGKVDSEKNWFFIPYVAKNWHLSDQGAFTLAFYGRGGMNTTYKGGSATFDPDGPGPAPIVTLPGVYGGGSTGVNLNQAFLEATYSFKVNDQFSVGIAPVLVYQMFEAEGLIAFSPYTETFARSGGMQMPANLTNNGSDSSTGVGIKLGGIWNATDALALSLVYQSEIKTSEFDEYSDLFAQQGSFDIPASLRAGLSFRANSEWAFHLDVEQTYYNNIDSVGNPLSNVAGCPTAGLGGTNFENCLGGDQGFGFGWDDVTVYQVGAEWEPADMDGMTFRFGYNYGEQPISPSDVPINILAPATVEQHLTAGFSIERKNGDDVSVALMYAPKKTVSGPNFFDPTQQIELGMHQFEIEVSYSFK